MDEIDEDDAEELMSIDDEDTSDDDGVAERLKEGDSEADNDPEDEPVGAVEDTEPPRETLAADEVTMLEAVEDKVAAPLEDGVAAPLEDGVAASLEDGVAASLEDGVAAPLEDETMLDELVLGADEIPMELAVDELSELITD
jgi:hypothetical protein